MNALARRVAARWGFQSVTLGWVPEIPSWVFDRYASKVAFAPSPEDQEAFSLAKESVNLTLPRFLDLLKKTLHDRYSLNASQRGNEIFYYFAAPNPVDSISLHYTVRNGAVLMDLGYVPFGAVTNRPDYSKAVEVRQIFKDPEMAGLYLMRMAKALLGRISGSKLSKSIAGGSKDMNLTSIQKDMLYRLAKAHGGFELIPSGAGPGASRLRTTVIILVRHGLVDRPSGTSHVEITEKGRQWVRENPEI